MTAHYSRRISTMSCTRTASATSRVLRKAARQSRRSPSAASVAYDLPREIEPFLDETTYYDPPNCTFPFGTHICVVEIDRDTGHVVPIKYVAVDDVGNVLNPLIVDGQVAWWHCAGPGSGAV